jgi:Ran GTPase-activating protein (RanGAP) involved in mRNA processing and transport
LNLYYNIIGDEGAVALANALLNNNSLTDLSLGDNIIGDKGAVELANALAYNNHLKGLYLSNNKIGDVGGIALANLLKYNNLTNLNFSENNINADGRAALTNALKYNISVIFYNMPVNIKTIINKNNIKTRNTNLISIGLSVSSASNKSLIQDYYIY